MTEALVSIAIFAAIGIVQLALWAAGESIWRRLLKRCECGHPFVEHDAHGCEGCNSIEGHEPCYARRAA